MSDHPDELELSQLVDGELDNDRANVVLRRALDDDRARDRLRSLLDLRQALASWRRQSPPHSLFVEASGPAARRAVRWRAASGLAAAAVLGGMLVAGGFLLAGRPARDGGGARQPVEWVGAVIASDDVRHAASAFALHESVAGPLSWFAVDERNVQFELENRRPDGGTPVAVFLTLSSADGRTAAKTNYMIVCRSDERASVQFTALPDGLPPCHVALAPTPRGDVIDMRYAIRLDQPAGRASAWASLAGQHALDKTHKRLGEIVVDGHTIVVSAGACAFPAEQSG